jgi:hypothetical protein
MEKSEEDRLGDYLKRFRQQRPLGASGALEQIRLLREVKRELPLQYPQFCSEIGITPRQEEQSYEIAYNLSILAEFKQFERQATLFAVSRMDEEFDDVWSQFSEWKTLNADQIRNKIVAERLEALAVEHEPGNDRLQ